MPCNITVSNEVQTNECKTLCFLKSNLKIKEYICERIIQKYLNFIVNAVCKMV